MNYTFELTEDGLVVAVVEDMPLLTHALKDSIGTRPLSGDPSDGMTTSWIDDALTNLRARIDDEQDDLLASGNVTYLQTRGDHVEARYDFDPLDSEDVDTIESHALLALLYEMRKVTVELDPAAPRRERGW